MDMLLRKMRAEHLHSESSGDNVAGGADGSGTGAAAAASAAAAAATAAAAAAQPLTLDDLADEAAGAVGCGVCRYIVLQARNAFTSSCQLLAPALFFGTGCLPLDALIQSYLLSPPPRTSQMYYQGYYLQRHGQKFSDSTLFDVVRAETASLATVYCRNKNFRRLPLAVNRIAILQ